MAHIARRFRAGLLVAVALATGACSASVATEVQPLPDEVPAVSADPTIAVKDNVFEAAELTVEVGEPVTWVWQGRAVHDVVGDGFDSGTQAEGTFEHTFTEPGTYEFVCTLHPGMEGTVYAVDG